jgi:dihydrofolate reductase
MFGRRSYELFAPVWRDSDDHAAYRDLPKYVVSRTLEESALVSGWGDIRILRSADDVAALKDTDGGAIFIHGSGLLTQQLAGAGLIDRYNALVFPVMLGAGKSIFSKAAAKDQRLTLRSTAAYANGVVKMVYDVTR